MTYDTIHGLIMKRIIIIRNAEMYEFENKLYSKRDL